MRRINPGPWQTSIGQHPAGKMIRDVGGILRQGLREPEQDKAPPGTGQRPDQEHKIIDRFEQHAVIVRESG